MPPTGTPTQATAKLVATQKRGAITYNLFNNHELWSVAPRSEWYFCGHVADPDILDYAIDNHKEELAYLIADAKAEFGF